MVAAEIDLVLHPDERLCEKPGGGTGEASHRRRLGRGRWCHRTGPAHHRLGAGDARDSTRPVGGLPLLGGHSIVNLENAIPDRLQLQG